MSKSLRNLIIATLFVIGTGVGWWLAAPLFFNQTVDEAFPSISEVQGMSAAEKEAMPDDTMETLKAEVEATAEAMPVVEANDAMPEGATAEPVLLYSGMFTGADEFHQGSGSVAIYELASGERVLRFEDFEVTNGPGLVVYFAENAAPTSSSDLGEHVRVEPLKGNIGNQNYTLPADLDLEQFGSVIIYCEPFSVLFSLAPLTGS